MIRLQKLDEEKSKTKMLLQIHDELIETPKNDVESVK